MFYASNIQDFRTYICYFIVQKYYNQKTRPDIRYCLQERQRKLHLPGRPMPF